ncbi:MAG TPA: sugar phosphate nucleotidyltransferase [Lentimicrobium sp.]|jgi:NDP-sugar pyrophosphorylase family protein|nr:sugar phosphate nucleotidyltransferase [Lentimicrobium sp.]
MKPTLVILAAGMGSRYGGLKQIDPVGPSGETILDYSVYDAIRAGFGKVVFIIRKDIEADFKEAFAEKLSRYIEVDWVFQELEYLPTGYTTPAGRTKPWGTGHAVMMTARKVHEPFAVINADDFYGFNAFDTLAGFFSAQQSEGKADYAMVGYKLSNTLSEFGSVSRGICETGGDNWLKSVTERTKIQRTGGKIVDMRSDGSLLPLEEDVPVSMNFWGFTPSVFEHIEKEFKLFLDAERENLKSEFYIPSLVDNLINSGRAQVKVLRTSALWFGITYKEDKPLVVNKIGEMIRRGEYPETLWK